MASFANCATTACIANVVTKRWFLKSISMSPSLRALLGGLAGYRREGDAYRPAAKRARAARPLHVVEVCHAA